MTEFKVGDWVYHTNSSSIGFIEKVSRHRHSGAEYEKYQLTVVFNIYDICTNQPKKRKPINGVPPYNLIRLDLMQLCQLRATLDITIQQFVADTQVRLDQEEVKNPASDNT